MRIYQAYKPFQLLMVAVLLTACASEREPADGLRNDEVLATDQGETGPVVREAPARELEAADMVPVTEVTTGAKAADSAPDAGLTTAAEMTTGAEAAATATPAVEDAITTTTTPVADVTTETAAADESTTASRPPDVGYEGLVQSIGNIERSLTPYFRDDMARISPEVAERLGRQTSRYVSEIKNAMSVDKNVRTEVREYAIDIHLAVQQMARASSSEHYRALRSAAQQRVEQIQAELMGARDKHLPQ